MIAYVFQNRLSANQHFVIFSTGGRPPCSKRSFCNQFVNILTRQRHDFTNIIYSHETVTSVFPTVHVVGFIPVFAVLKRWIIHDESPQSSIPEPKKIFDSRLEKSNAGWQNGGIKAERQLNNDKISQQTKIRVPESERESKASAKSSSPPMQCKKLPFEAARTAAIAVNRKSVNRGTRSWAVVIRQKNNSFGVQKLPINFAKPILDPAENHPEISFERTALDDARNRVIELNREIVREATAILARCRRSDATV